MKGTIDVMSTQIAVAHSPMPKAWAHLIRHFVTPSPRGEGFGADRNIMSTKSKITVELESKITVNRGEGFGAHRNSANLTQSYAFEYVRSRGHVT